MNIVVITSNGKCIVRPDTTWERDNEDFFPPEFVDRLSYSPVLFARISKPGRSVGEKFADRYYDGIGYGVLLYPQDLVDGSETGYACASCLDHTTFLPFPLYNKITLGQGNEFKLYVSKGTTPSRRIFVHDAGTAQMIEAAIAEATKYVYVRSGDILAIELKPRRALCRRADGEVSVKGKYCGNITMDFRIKY